MTGDQELPAPARGEHETLSGFFSQVSPRLVALVLFLLALLPRLPGLRLFLISDENTNIFRAGSDVVAALLQGDLRETYWHFYPGVTMSWLDGIGMTGQYLFDRLGGASVPPFTEYIYGDILSLLVANRLPYVFLTAAAVSSTYLLARKLLPEPAALLGALFMAFDPFFLAHSRVVHGDAPVAVFMSLSALAFFIYAEYKREGKDSYRRLPGLWTRPYLLLSAVLGSLAALTKAPGQFMAFFIVGIAGLYAGLDLYLAWKERKLTDNADEGSSYKQKATNILVYWLLTVLVWGFVSLAVFILLWPSMWVDPIGTFQQMLSETFGKVNEGHLVYFFGQPTLDPGPWFYFYVIPFRMTPVALIGAGLSLLFLVPSLTQSGIARYSKFSPLFLLWFFIITLLLFGNLSPKKQDRYLLPLFPFLNLVAAVGWWGFLNLIYDFFRWRLFQGEESGRRIFPLILYFFLTLLIMLHFTPVLTYYPYYLTYFNSLMGGPTRAAETTLMGWGEGMEQAAAYLNTKPDAANLYVASTPSQTLLPYFAGAGENFYTNDIALRADYVVLYLAQRQRRAPSPEIVAYFERQRPEKTITIKDIPYALIYPGPKFILTGIPPEAVPVNIGLAEMIRLAGYEMTRPASKEPGFSITLYWHALARLTADYTISIRLRAEDGDLLAQQDSWPVQGLLRTSQWRQGDYVADTHTLDLTGSELDRASHVEIVVYHLDSGETLGPPVILNLEEEQ